MFKLRSVICVFILALLTSCAGTSVTPSQTSAASASLNLSKYRKMAVIVNLDRWGSRQSVSRSRVIENSVMNSLIKKGYVIPSRSSDLKKILQEMKLQNSGLTNGDAAKVGRILNASAIFVIDLSELERKRLGSGAYQANRTYATLSGRVVSVETSEVLWVGTKTGNANDKYTSTPELITDLATALASEL